MKNNKPLIAALLVAAFSLGFFINNLFAKEKIDNDLVICVENFVASICSGNNSNILELAAGDILFKLNNFKNDIPAEIVNIQIAVEDNNSQYALVRCQVDLKLYDDSYDVYWYDIELVNKEGWKVFNVMPAKPFTNEKDSSNLNIEILKYVLTEYTKLANQDAHKAIGKYTAGQVRRSLEIYVNENEKIPEITEFLDVKPLKETKNLVVVDTTYKIDDRVVDNIVTFYKTKEGWKIVDIQSSLVK